MLLAGAGCRGIRSEVNFFGFKCANSKSVAPRPSCLTPRRPEGSPITIRACMRVRVGSRLHGREMGVGKATAVSCVCGAEANSYRTEPTDARSTFNSPGVRTSKSASNPETAPVRTIWPILQHHLPNNAVIVMETRALAPSLGANGVQTALLHKHHPGARRPGPTLVSFLGNHSIQSLPWRCMILRVCD